MTGNNLPTFRSRRGFTLMESVTVLGIFGLTVLTVTGLLMNSFSFQRKINAQQEVAGNARDTLEAIAREIRLDQIDYKTHIIDYTDDLSVPQNHLHLIGADGALTFQISQNDPLIPDGVLLANYRPLSSEDMVITSLQFVVRPTTDPFLVQTCTVNADCANFPGLGTCTPAGLCAVDNQQPRVTIFLSARNRETNPQKIFTVELQTTVASRVYKR